MFEPEQFTDSGANCRLGIQLCPFAWWGSGKDVGIESQQCSNRGCEFNRKKWQLQWRDYGELSILWMGNPDLPFWSDANCKKCYFSMKHFIKCFLFNLHLKTVSSRDEHSNATVVFNARSAQDSKVGGIVGQWGQLRWADLLMAPHVALCSFLLWLLPFA